MATAATSAAATAAIGRLRARWCRVMRHHSATASAAALLHVRVLVGVGLMMHLRLRRVCPRRVVACVMGSVAVRWRLLLLLLLVLLLLMWRQRPGRLSRIRRA